MFKIKVEDLSNYADEKKTPYLIRYELCPEYSEVRGKVIYHESKFTSLKKALHVASDMSKYFQDSYYFLDLVYTKIKQLENSILTDSTYKNVDFSEVEINRIKLNKGMHVESYAYKHIENILIFLNSLKGLCFSISKRFDLNANYLFSLLDSFYHQFKNTYRSSQILSEKKLLNFFNV